MARKLPAPSLRIVTVLCFTLRPALAASALLLLAGCDQPSGIGELSVNELDSLVRSAHPPVVYDANGATVRAQYGVIPGARLLASAANYDLRALLPQDQAQHLVFYCATRWCSAARVAAGRARAAGHHNVDLLPAGIRGWSQAGKRTTSP